MQNCKNFYPENRGDLLKNFEQENNMIRLHFRSITLNVEMWRFN